MVHEIDFKFDTQIDCSNSQPQTTIHPWKESGDITWPILNFVGHIHCSGMAEAMKLSKFVHA